MCWYCVLVNGRMVLIDLSIYLSIYQSINQSINQYIYQSTSSTHLPQTLHNEDTVLVGELAAAHAGVQQPDQGDGHVVVVATVNDLHCQHV